VNAPLPATAKSHRLIEVLKTIKTGPKKRQELKEILGITTSHLSQVLKKLEQQQLVRCEGEAVRILPKGELFLRMHRVNQRFNTFLQNFGDFVNDFDLSDIPDWLISRMYELDSIDVVDVHGDFLEPHNEFFSALAQAVKVKGYTSVFFREHVGFFFELAEKGVDLEIIVSEEVFRRKILIEFSDELQKGLSLSNVRFYVSKKKFRFAFAVT